MSVNLSKSTFGPDGATVDAMREVIAMVRKSLHEAIERGDWHQVRGLTSCMIALERSADSLCTLR